MFCFPLQSTWDLAIHPPFGDPTSSLAHHPVFDFDIICNSLNPPLADNVWFGLLRIAVNKTRFETI